MRRYSSGLYDQVEVHADPEFYHELMFELQKNSDIQCSYPLRKMEGLPQVIEIVSGFLLAIDILLKVYEIYSRKKPRVLVRLKDGEVIELNSEGVEKLRVIVEEGNETEE